MTFPIGSVGRLINYHVITNYHPRMVTKQCQSQQEMKIRIWRQSHWITYAGLPLIVLQRNSPKCSQFLHNSGAQDTEPAIFLFGMADKRLRMPNGRRNE